jgi:NhaP-type Na+/H+ or K+/H+ antiporter
VPYPILLVLGGLVLGFVPGMPTIKLVPELVLVLFLPPLLYWSGFFTSPRELRADLHDLAAGSRAGPGDHERGRGDRARADRRAAWAAAFALGAIISPTDPLAVPRSPAGWACLAA